MPKRLNPNKAKIHRNYTVEEAAELFEVHKNTVRLWIKAGLPKLDDKRPVLILGRELRAYLQDRRWTRKRRCKPYEFYCMRCRTPQRPAGDMVDYVPLGGSTGRLVAICPTCYGMVNRFVGEASLAKISAYLDVSIPKAVEHLSKHSVALVNSDFS